MLLSLSVYTGTALVMAWLGYHVSQREQQVLKKGGRELSFLSWEILAAIVIYVAVSAVRWLTSWDYNMYYNYFVSMQSTGVYSRENFEPGFSLLTIAMARAGFHFSAYFAFWALVQISLLYYALRHRKVLLPWLALCIFLGPYYIFWMGFIRQSVVECLFVLMVELIVRRKFWIYLLLTLLAVSIHRMCILFLLLYLVPLISGPRNAGKWISYAAIVVCVLLGSFPQWLRFLFDHIGSLADYLGYGHYYRLFLSDNLEYAFRGVMGPSRLCPLLTLLVIIWYYPVIKQSSSSSTWQSAIYRFSLLYMCYINLFANTTQYLSRPGELMRGCFLVMVCCTLHYLWKQRLWLPFAVMAFCNFYYVFYEMAKAEFIPASIYTPAMYHSFLF